jgi:hypothetical protein
MLVLNQDQRVLMESARGAIGCVPLVRRGGGSRGRLRAVARLHELYLLGRGVKESHALSAKWLAMARDGHPDEGGDGR